MIIEHHSNPPRSLRTETLSCDLAVLGGGLAGLCCAVTAARAGLNVVLVQDRPVLGGNASSEVRLWTLGATSHMGNNNRWAREGGLIDEILVENTFRNPEGNALVFDTLLLEKAVAEPNLRLLLNTAVFELQKENAQRISAVRAFCPQNSTIYEITAPLFCDATGDGIAGFLAGAAFRIGAEGRQEFDEGFAPAQAGRELLGHSIYFYSKDTGRPVGFVPPAFALKDITKIPRWRDFKAGDSGCRLWWIEHGGLLDTVHDTERIKWELWQVVYGVWNFIKNSGRFPEAENLTLEWVGTIPGKRESRRFEGDYMISQRDLVEQREHADAVSFGGWAIDVHPPEGVFSEQPGCLQWHTKGVYGIPYRCLYSKNIENLFLAGRIISASHIAFASTRVMATCAHGGQAVGIAAALCTRRQIKPADLGATAMEDLHRELLKSGQFIPGVALDDPADLVHSGTLQASSELHLQSLPDNREVRPMEFSGAMMLPLPVGQVPQVTFTFDVLRDTVLEARLMISSKPCNHTPDIEIGSLSIPLHAGQNQAVCLPFDCQMPHAGYGFFAVLANPDLSVHLSDSRLTGVLFVGQRFNRAVAKTARQEPAPDIGVDAFDFWIPERRPNGKNFALTLSTPLSLFGAENLLNGISRPTFQPNAWVADFNDANPELRVNWDSPRLVERIELTFDTDLDHPMESVLMGHPETVMPFCVPAFEIASADGTILWRVEENHQTRRAMTFSEPVSTKGLVLRLRRPAQQIPAALFEFRCYAHDGS
jgi:hypothetical protein